MQVTLASIPGTSSTNEDTVLASPDAVVVLDGLSAPADLPMGCHHGTAWYVHKLGARLLDLASDASCSLAEALAEAIDQVNTLHVGTCHLDQDAVPATTVAMIRLRGEALDYLVLSDTVLVLDILDEGLRVIVDKTVGEVAQEETVRALECAPGSAEHAARVSELVAVQRRLRNRPNGYWVASTISSAADHALTGTLPRERVRRAALLTDGASRPADQFGTLTWSDLLDLLENDGPAALLALTRETEESDPHGARWPRFKRSDDATAAFALFPAPSPITQYPRRVVDQYGLEG